MARPPRRNCDSCGARYRPRVLNSTHCAACRVTPQASRIDPLSLIPSNELAGIDPASIRAGSRMSGVSSSATKDDYVVVSDPTVKPRDKVSVDDILAIWNLDPEEWEIVGDVKFNTWNGYKRISKDVVEIVPLYQYTVRCRPRSEKALAKDEFKHLLGMIEDAKKTPKRPVGEATFVIDIGDIQMGKADGDGSPGTMARLMNLISQTTERIEELRARGREMGECVVIVGGDIIEHVNGHYAMQGFTTDLNLTQQEQAVRRWFVKFLKELAPLFTDVLVIVVPGNHGEAFRIDGKSATDFDDNFDVAILRQVSDVLDENPAYAHVKFMFPPKGELLVVTEIRGHLICALHGHQANGPAAIPERVGKWIKEQAAGFRQVLNVEYFFTHHYHHAFVYPIGPRWVFGGGALDGGSAWFTHTRGQETPPCAVSLVIDAEGWRDYQPIWGIPQPPQWKMINATIHGDPSYLE